MTKSVLQKSDPLRSPSYRAPWLLRGLNVGVAVLLILCVAAAVVQWLGWVTSPLDLDYAERWHAYTAYQAFPGGDHVTAPNALPYNALPYPPFSYLVHGSLGHLLGADLLGVRTIGRITALLATLVNALLVALIGRSLGVNGWLSGMAALLFLSSNSAHFFAVSLRPDELACAFMLAGLYARLIQRNQALVGGLWAIALTTKHSFLALPLVSFVTLAIKRDWKTLGAFLVGGMAVGLSILGLSQICLGSHWWQGSLLQGFHGANPKQMIFFLGEGFRQPALVLGVVSLVLLELRGRIAIVAAGFVVSLLFNSVALVKVGAAGNYFLEPVALGTILAAYTMQKMVSAPEEPLPHRPIAQDRLPKRAIGAIWGLVLVLMIPITVTQVDATLQARKTPPDLAAHTAMVQTLRQVNGPILTMDAGLYFDAQKAPFACPPDLLMAAIDAGKIDGQAMTDLIQQQYFKAIVLYSNWLERPFFPQSWISAIQQRYQSATPMNGLVILRPQS
jgi:hypothetical protein